ncbi:hypothetical protein GCM10010306_099960 [Streptomyces umbrinus]|nr:hypothetical protein GCM10010306_099960 [Streptomyces umbrinus]
MARADDIVYGDLILAAVSLHGTDYFNDQYTAHPQPYNPECGCGVCCHLTHEPSGRALQRSPLGDLQPVARRHPDVPGKSAGGQLRTCSPKLARPAGSSPSFRCSEGIS